MKLVEPKFEILNMTDINLIELAGRTCYKSEDLITKDSAEKFVKMIDERGHRAMLEHSFASVRIICDRGVSHEIVRHRLFSFAQESTRYCNYSKNKFEGVTFIIPPWVNLKEGKYEINTEADVWYHYNNEPFDICELDSNSRLWLNMCKASEDAYLSQLSDGLTPQQARAVLINSLKTEIVVSGNFREWQHFFKLRADKAAHPQMREIAVPLCEAFEAKIPSIKWR